MADYDISKAFETIENELINSMMRNFKNHRAEEEKEGYNWSQWQSEQLKSLEQYRRTNQKKYGKQFSTLNKKIEEMLKTAMADGNAKQEAEILKAIKKGFNVGKVSPSATGEFFKVNDRKLDALINATKSDMEKAETAILRMSNDKYRKAIINAQIYANSGAGTYGKAVDMAVKDMLQAGLNCVEYRNGARHTLSDYADMAIRTANKRAYLYGEGQKRQEWGISLVVVNSRQGGCPDCAQYIGRVFIDDVYSGGSKADGNYPLLSEAIAGGLFHPRCKDSTSTYYEGITSLEPVSNEEIAKMEERETLETKQQNAERQEKRYNRLAQHSLDENNKIKYQNRADDWHKIAKQISSKFEVREESKSKYVNENTVVNEQIINSPTYRRTINKLGENNKISRIIFQNIKKVLKHRTGSEFEDLSFINSLTGETRTRTDYSVFKECIPSRKMRQMVMNSEPNTIISMHNHPNSSVPSMSDIQTAYERQYKYGIIACHNGNIYKYSVTGKYNYYTVDLALEKLERLIYNKDIIKDFDEKWNETLEDLKKNNVNLEVFLWK